MKNVTGKPSELIILAINSLDEEDGSSQEEIVTFISEECKMNPAKVKSRVHTALVRAQESGLLSQKDGRYLLQEIPKLAEGDVVVKRAVTFTD